MQNKNKLLKKMFFRLLILTAVSTAFFSCTDQGAWDLLGRQFELEEELKNWKKRIKITIDNSAQAETFTDFPVLVKLNTGNISYSDLKADGSDLSFYTSNLDARLDYEIDTWNISGDSFIWVKIPSIAAGSDSGFFWMYYSSNENKGNENPDSVWSDNYRAVYHLDENGSSYKDSSPNNNTGTGGTNGQTDPVSTAGVIGEAQNFSLNTDSIAVSADPSINNLGPLTYSFWVYNTANEGDRLLSKGNFEFWVPSNTRIRVDILHSDGLLQSEYNCMPGDTWSYVVLTWDGTPDETQILSYQDGVPEIPVNSQDRDGTRESDAASDLFIGNDTFFGASNGKNCMLDEFQISGKVRSASWVNAQYLSQTDSYLTYAAAEDL